MRTNEAQLSARARVLVVEDEPRLRTFLEEEIADMGYPAAGARSAEEAQRLMRTSPDDILVLDLNLPGMDGMEFFRLLRARWPLTQVIILTGVGTLASAREAIHLEVVDFLTKPCHLDELERALARASERVRQGRIPPASQDGALPQAAPAAAAQRPPQGSGDPGKTADDHAAAPLATLADRERGAILEALQRNHGNRSAAARELGISRRTLHYRLAEYQRLGLPH